MKNLSLNFLLVLAKAIDRGDIEFTVCELNCHNTHEDQTSPQHTERKPRFSSFKKSGAISKAVRSKLNKSSKSSERQQQSSEKQNSCGENSSSFDGAEKNDTVENGKTNENQENSATTPTSAKSVPGKVVKKKSKLCLLL